MSARCPEEEGERPDGNRRAVARRVIALLGLLAGLSAFASVAAGPTGWQPVGALLTALRGGAAPDTLVLLDIRLPRTIFALLTGSALAAAGCVLQGLFRNPLADPGLIGTSSGAALAAVLVIVLGDGILAALPTPVRSLALPLAAFAGALGATALLYAVATRDGQTGVATMLLAGIALGALASAVIGLLIFASDERQLRDLTFWTLGSLGSATWTRVALLAPVVAVALALFQRNADALDALLLGETDARAMGVDVERAKRRATVAAAAAVGAAVGMTGVIGFVGVIVPHLLRGLIGPLHRALVPACALGGAALLTLADIGARLLVTPAELPIGILTALVGAPFFLWLLVKRRALAGL